MKKRFSLFVFLLTLSFLSTPAFASHSFDLGHCEKSDAVCVGEVMLDKLNHMGHDTENALKIAFYHTDDCKSKLLYTMTFTDDSGRNERLCRRIAPLVDATVWGVQLSGGECINISDTDFLSACLAYR